MGGFSKDKVHYSPHLAYLTFSILNTAYNRTTGNVEKCVVVVGISPEYLRVTYGAHIENV